MTSTYSGPLRYREVQLTLDASAEEMNKLYRSLNDAGTVHLWRGDKTIFGTSDFADKFQEWVKKEFGYYFFIRHDRHGLVGCVFEYARSLQHGYTKITIILDARCINMRIGPIAMALFVDHVLRNCRIDSIIWEIYGFNVEVLRMLRSLGRYLGEPIEEAVLREHHHWDGRFWDFHFFTLRRSQWPPIATALLPNRPMNGLVAAPYPRSPTPLAQSLTS